MRPLNHDKEPEFYPQDNGKVLKGLEQGSGMIRFATGADHSDGREKGRWLQAIQKAPRPFRKELVL